MLTEITKYELKTFKPTLKYKLGDQVFLKSDEKRRWPMLVVNFDTDEDSCSDYYCKWVNSQGIIEQDCFPEEALVN